MATRHTVAEAPAAGNPRRGLRPAGPRVGEKAIKAFLFLCAALAVLVTTAIVLSLIFPTVDFFQQVSMGAFVTDERWAPGFSDPSFGVWPIVVGSLMGVFFALLTAIPIGLLSAVYLAEYAKDRVRRAIKPILEVLAGVPTVAIGLFAFWFLRPLAEKVLPFLAWEGIFSIGVAGVAVGLLIVPLIASVSDDALRSVPGGLREGAFALGASKLKVTTRVVFPAAISGIVAAVVLGTSRAIGETMVFLIAGGAGTPIINWDPTGSSATMTAYIARTATGDIATGTITYNAIFAVGSLLFVSTLLMNMLAMRMVRRFREEYE